MATAGEGISLTLAFFPPILVFELTIPNTYAQRDIILVIYKHSQAHNYHVIFEGQT